MRFFSTTLLALSALASCVFAVPTTTSDVVNPTDAVNDNAISAPTQGDIVTRGSDFTIVWAPDSAIRKVSLTLKKGPTALNNILQIANDIDNSGSYLWKVDKTIEPADDYSIEIRWAAGTNYSPLFTISDGTSISSSGTSTSTKTSSGTASSTINLSTITSGASSSTTTSTRKPSTSPTADPTGNGGATNINGSGKMVEVSSVAVIVGAMVIFAAAL